MAEERREAMTRIATAIAALIAIPSAASAFCMAPSEPYCIRSFGTFDDEFSFDSCRREIDSYESDLSSFLDCQNRATQDAGRKIRDAQEEIDTAQRESQSALEDFNSAVAYWNCKAEGGSIC